MLKDHLFLSVSVRSASACRLPVKTSIPLKTYHVLRHLQEKPAKGRLFHTQKNLAEMEECCEHPWRDLFLWAVLQNRQHMANYFWAMVSLFGITGVNQ